MLSKTERKERREFGRLLNQHLRQVEGLSEVPTFKVYTATRTSRRPPVAELNTALTAPAKLVEELDPQGKFIVIWDSGASCTISNNKDDFTHLVDKTGDVDNEQIDGLAKGLTIAGEGWVQWGMIGVNGKVRVFDLPALYIPDSPVRLLSTTSLTKTCYGERVILDSQKAYLTGQRGNTKRIPVVAVNDPRTDIPTSVAFLPKLLKPAIVSLNNIITTVHKANLNLTDPEKELLRWHYRLGHLDFRRIQFLMRAGTLAHTAAARSLHTAASKIKQCPKCAACQYGKQCRNPVKGKTTTTVRDEKGATSKTAHLPGQLVAVDHFICSTKGRRFNTRGMEADKDRYLGGAIFVDLATGYLSIEFQTNVTTHETLLGKEKFELECRDHGVVVQEYLSDMGAAFTSQAFREHLQEFEQVSRFAGAGGHHHNAQAERAIRTVTCIARTIMFHQAIHWPEVADPVNWPLAMRHAVFLANMVPDAATGHSAFDRFTQSRWPKSRLLELHVWGCPAYALETKLANGQKIPRFTSRSTRMIYAGPSPSHASSVPMILNPESGYIKVIFNVVMDDWFASVATSIEDLPDFHSPEWAAMFGESEFQYPVDEDDEDAAVDSPPSIINSARESRVRFATENATQVPPTEDVPLAFPDPVPSQVPSTPEFSQRELSSLREVSHLREPPSRESAPVPEVVSSSQTGVSPLREQWLNNNGSTVVLDDDGDPIPDLAARVNYDSDDDDDLPPLLDPKDSDSDDDDDTDGFPPAPKWASGQCAPTPPTPRHQGPPSNPPSGPTGLGRESGRQASTPRQVSPSKVAKAPTKSYWEPTHERRPRKQDKKYQPFEAETTKKKSVNMARRPDTALPIEEEFLSDLVMVPSCYHATLFPEFGSQVPLCLIAKKSKKQHPDIFTFDECMRSPDRPRWIKA